MTAVLDEAAARALAHTLFELERHSESGAKVFSVWTETEFFEELLNPQCQIFLWSKDAGKIDLSAEPDGFVLSRDLDDASEIMDLAVKHKGRGWGTQLLQSYLTFARGKNFERVFLEVAAGNEPAIRTYQRCGFVRQRVRERYYRDGQDAWVMSWEKST